MTSCHSPLSKNATSKPTQMSSGYGAVDETTPPGPPPRGPGGAPRLVDGFRVHRPDQPVDRDLLPVLLRGGVDVADRAVDAGLPGQAPRLQRGDGAVEHHRVALHPGLLEEEDRLLEDLRRVRREGARVAQVHQDGERAAAGPDGPLHVVEERAQILLLKEAFED